MKKYIILLFLITSTVYNCAVFADSWILDNYSSKSIKELNAGIGTLNEINNELNIDFLNLNKDFKLKSFFKEYLVDSEIKYIESIINNYTSEKTKLEKILEEKAYKLEDTSDEKKVLLDEKKEFYKSLLPFIKIDKISEYLDYIALDVKILKEQKDISEKIIINNEIISNKVVKIEALIKEHREFLNEKFKIIVEENVNLKIEKLKNNDKFTKLTKELKEEVLKKILTKINITISNSESVNDKTDALVKKIEIYKIIRDKLEEFKMSL